MRTTSDEHRKTVEDVWVCHFTFSFKLPETQSYKAQAHGQRIHLQGQLLWLVFRHRRVLLHWFRSHTGDSPLYIANSCVGLHVYARCLAYHLRRNRLACGMDRRRKLHVPPQWIQKRIASILYDTRTEHSTAAISRGCIEDARRWKRRFIFCSGYFHFPPKVTAWMGDSGTRRHFPNGVRLVRCPLDLFDRVGLPLVRGANGSGLLACRSASDRERYPEISCPLLASHFTSPFRASLC